MVQAANILGTANANDPLTVKALLLNGAIKPLYVTNPADKWMHTDTAPLDTRYGAGVLNVFNSYKQLSAGRREPGSYTDVQSGWDLSPSRPQAPRHKPLPLPVGLTMLRRRLLGIGDNIEPPSIILTFPSSTMGASCFQCQHGG
jgi:hypothetical protein